MKESKEYLTVLEAARLLGTSTDKILAWIHSGELLANDISIRQNCRPRWRVSRAELDKFLAKRSSKPPAQTRRKSRRDSESTPTYV